MWSLSIRSYLKEFITKSLLVIMSKTGSPVACRTASEYAESSVHSNKNALRLGCFFNVSFARSTTPGSTFLESTSSPKATASNPSTSSAPTNTILSSRGNKFISYINPSILHNVFWILGSKSYETNSKNLTLPILRYHALNKRLHWL